MYLLDTDHISIVQRQSEPEYTRLLARLKAHDPTDFYVPIVSFHEQVVGWNAYLNRARTAESVVRAYDMFQRILADFAAMAVAAFDLPASSTFESLRASQIRIGTMDLRIAAIALANDWTLLSRNSVDFCRVPSLRVEDWTL
ncbi:MAG: type II toxin-antitoxin system VapC family toxin [Pirellulaceae bacterium]